MTDEQKALVPTIGSELAVKVDQALLDDATSGSGFLPYFQLFTSKADAVAEGKIGVGEYGLVSDGVVNPMGKEVDVVVYTVRNRAFYKDDAGEITVLYDKDDPEYQRIKVMAAAKVKGAMCGPEFLLWIPSQATFTTFFCGSPTLKRECKKFGPYLGGKACTMRQHLIDRGGYKWHGPLIGPCSTPPTALPDDEAVATQIDCFKNPPQKKAAEKASDDATDAVER